MIVREILKTRIPEVFRIKLSKGFQKMLSKTFFYYKISLVFFLKKKFSLLYGLINPFDHIKKGIAVLFSLVVLSLYFLIVAIFFHQRS